MLILSKINTANNIKQKYYLLLVYRTCCKTNKIWYWIEETGSSSVAINKKLIFNHFISFIP